MDEKNRIPIESLENVTGGTSVEELGALACQMTIDQCMQLYNQKLAALDSSRPDYLVTAQALRMKISEMIDQTIAHCAGEYHVTLANPLA